MIKQIHKKNSSQNKKGNNTINRRDIKQGTYNCLIVVNLSRVTKLSVLLVKTIKLLYINAIVKRSSQN